MKKTFNIQTCKHLSIIALSFLVICFTACKKSGSIPDITTAASINITNAAETAGPQDLYLDGVKANATPLAYTQSSGYINISAAQHVGEFKTSSTGVVNATFNAVFEPGHYYSVYYADDKTSTGAEDSRIPPISTQAKVRFLNLSTAFNSNIDFTLTGGTSIVSSLQFKTFSDYYPVAANAAFALNVSGSSAIILNIPAALQVGHIYTIYISGSTQATLAYHIVTEL